MSDLISRADAMTYIERVINSGLGRNKSLDYIHKYISALPSAEAEPIVIRSKTLLPTKDFTEWAKRIKEENPNAVVIPCDAEVVSAEAVQGWISFTRRPMTEEEQKDYPNCTFMFDCVLPDDGDEILVSNGRFVWMDVFCNDIDGCYLDGGDDIGEDMAWMPLPKPYREDGEKE